MTVGEAALVVVGLVGRSLGVIRAGGMPVTIAGPPEARPAVGLAIDFVVMSGSRPTG